MTLACGKCVVASTCIEDGKGTDAGAAHESHGRHFFSADVQWVTSVSGVATFWMGFRSR